MLCVENYIFGFVFKKSKKTEERSNSSVCVGGNERKKRENNRSAAGVLNHRCSLKGIMVKKNSGAEQKPKNGIKKVQALRIGLK